MLKSLVSLALEIAQLQELAGRDNHPSHLTLKSENFYWNHYACFSNKSKFDG